MKIALYIEDGLEQIVLTPEGKVEKDILAKLHDGQREIALERGSFYECQGGYVRQSPNDTSTMIVLRPPAQQSSGREM
jgi:hypothetical protein